MYNDYYKFVTTMQECTEYLNKLEQTINSTPPHAIDNGTIAFCAAVSVSAIAFVEKVGSFAEKVYKLLPDNV